MTAALTPALALSYLHELSLDVRDAVVLDAAGTPLAGEPALAARVSALIAGVAPGIVVCDGSLLAAGTSDGGVIAVLAGNLALLPLLEHDLAAVAAGLATAPVDLPGSRDSLS